MSVSGPLEPGGMPPNVGSAGVGSIGEIFVIVESPNSPRIENDLASLSLSASPQIQSVVPSPPQRARTSRSQQKPAFKAVMSAVERNEGFPVFNRIADSLKKNPDWKGEIKAQVSQLNEEGLNTLINVRAVDLRGYNREVLMEIFSAAEEVMSEKGLLSSDAEKNLSNLVLSLKTDVFYVPESDMKYLGGGAVNQVFEVKIGGESFVFKPDSSELDSVTLMKEQHFGTAVASGIPPGIDAHLSSRAVASSKVDSLLYGANTISVETKFVIINDQRGILMKMASGESPKTSGLEKVEVNPKDNPVVVTAINQRILSKGKLSGKDLKMFAAALNCRSLKLSKNQDGKTVLIGKRAKLEHLDPNNSITAEGLMRLQIKDIITGECDRHPENYFIDDDGKVTGIDEDCCFGVNAIPEGVDVRSQPSIKFVVPNNASLMLRMPPVVTIEVKDHIERLNSENGKAELVKTLEPYISPEEINATLIRLNKLHMHIGSQDCSVVNTKEELLSPDSRTRMDSNNSYLGRETMAYDSDKKGWNHLREYRKF